MREPDFWTSYAEAMEACAEGNRLIARDIVDLTREMWQRAVRGFDAVLESLGQHKHLPPF